MKTYNVFFLFMLDLDSSLFGHTSDQLQCVNNTDGITNATYGIIWCLAGKWSPSIVCLHNTGMSCRYKCYNYS